MVQCKTRLESQLKLYKRTDVRKCYVTVIHRAESRDEIS